MSVSTNNSTNNGTPKSSILIGFSHYKPSILVGFTPIFGATRIYTSTACHGGILQPVMRDSFSGFG